MVVCSKILTHDMPNTVIQPHTRKKNYTRFNFKIENDLNKEKKNIRKCQTNKRAQMLLSSWTSLVVFFFSSSVDWSKKFAVIKWRVERFEFVSHIYVVPNGDFVFLLFVFHRRLCLNTAELYIFWNETYWNQYQWRRKQTTMMATNVGVKVRKCVCVCVYCLIQMKWNKTEQKRKVCAKMKTITTFQTE